MKQENLKYIKELFRVVSIDSILIIDREGQLKKIYCPFPVEVLMPVGKYDRGIVVFEILKTPIQQLRLPE